MSKKLLVTLFTIISAVSFAQMDEYEIETVEKNISKQNASDTAQDDYFKGSNDAYDTANSPQINIYNANSNANKQHQKNKQAQDQESEQKSKQEAVAQADAGQEFIQRANDIRNSRKNMEVGTEQKMIEKIEWSRIEDEKERADRLFGNRLEKKKVDYDNGYEDSYKSEKPVVVEKQTYAAAPAPAPYTETVAMEYKDTSTSWGEETYISPLIGMGSYNSASNVRSGDGAIGIAVGKRMETGVGVDVGFLYSTYEMDDYTVGPQSNPGLKDITQYNLTLGLKYSFDMGRVSPFVGVLGGYTYRQYEELKKKNVASADSSAFDAGLNAGLDVKLAKNFSVGAEYRWMRNISNDRDVQKDAVANSICQQNTGGVCQPLEELSYGTFLVNGKITF